MIIKALYRNHNWFMLLHTWWWAMSGSGCELCFCMQLRARTYWKHMHYYKLVRLLDLCQHTSHPTSARPCRLSSASAQELASRCSSQSFALDFFVNLSKVLRATFALSKVFRLRNMGVNAIQHFSLVTDVWFKVTFKTRHSHASLVIKVKWWWSALMGKSDIKNSLIFTNDSFSKYKKTQKNKKQKMKWKGNLGGKKSAF